jgi:lysophospholipase L1-like esterase
MRRFLLQRLALVALVAATAAASAAGTAAARTTEIGAVRLEHRSALSDTRPPALLVPVRYARYMAGRRATVRVELLGAQGILKRARASARLSAGLQRRPDRRPAFRFVHRVRLGKRIAASLAGVERVRVRVSGRLDADGDGHVEARSADLELQRLRGGSRVRPTCASVPVRRVRPRGTVRFDLPSCDRGVRWSLGVRPRHGSARRIGGTIAYRAGRGHRGLDELSLRGRTVDGGASRAAEISVPVALYVGPAGTAGLKVRALGDSVTAGFGFYSNGKAMFASSLFDCRPAASGYNDACSSNSLTTNSSSGGLSFAPDYGLANNVSWAAQWANVHGITNYANVAVSGSAPGDWAPGGSLYEVTQSVEADDPDYVVLTLGANPLLSNILFGLDPMRCALESDLFGDFTTCVEMAFANVNLEQNLSAIYQELLAKTDATILLMQYHLSIPFIALAYRSVQLERMGDLLNDTIASVAASLDSARLQVVTPPRFNVGIDMTPLAPNTFTCSRLGFQVDGPSVQAKVTQRQLLITHPLSFCGGPADGGKPWVIGADTGIHPSAQGYAQMAGALPPP